MYDIYSVLAKSYIYTVYNIIYNNYIYIYIYWGRNIVLR